MLFDDAGRRQGTLEWTVAPHDEGFTDWLRSGIVFLVARAARGSKTKITFYSSVSGGPIGAEDLDPADLLPYDAAAYAGLSRDAFCLKHGTGAWWAGVLLDVWHDARFALETNTLLLATCRPTSAPVPAPHVVELDFYVHRIRINLDRAPRWLSRLMPSLRLGDRELVCQAAERWAQVELAP